MKKYIFYFLTFNLLLALAAHAEPGDKDDWKRISDAVTAAPEQMALFNKIHEYKDGWHFVNRADKPYTQLYERHNSDGTYTCDLKENGSMKMQYIVSKKSCADADFQALAK